LNIAFKFYCAFGFVESEGYRLTARFFHRQIPTDRRDGSSGGRQLSPNKNTAELGGNPSESETFYKACAFKNPNNLYKSKNNSKLHDQEL